MREGGDAAVQNALDLLKADPLRGEPLAEIFVPLIAGRASDLSKRAIGDQFIFTLEHASPELLEHISKGVVALKRNFVDADYLHRNFCAYRAYLDFCSEVAREPSKPKLKEYFIARPDRYKNAPLDNKSGVLALAIPVNLSLRSTISLFLNKSLASQGDQLSAQLVGSAGSQALTLDSYTPIQSTIGIPQKILVSFTASNNNLEVYSSANR